MHVSTPICKVFGSRIIYGSSIVVLSNLLSRALLLSEFLVVEECEELICSPIKWNIICRLKILNKFFQVLLFHFLYAFIIVVHNL